MITLHRSDKQGDHVRVSVFAGHNPDHLALTGTLVMLESEADELAGSINTHKRCTCCGHHYSAAAWCVLPYRGEQLSEDETGKYSLELRNCTKCSTTLGVERKVG